MTNLLAFLHARRATTGAAGEGVGAERNVMIDTNAVLSYNLSVGQTFAQERFLNAFLHGTALTTAYRCTSRAVVMFNLGCLADSVGA